MVINTNLDLMLWQKTARINQQEVNSHISKISSGTKLSAKEDASGLAISMNMKAQMSGIKVAIQNAEEASSILQEAYIISSTVADILTRMRDLSLRLCNQATLTCNPADPSSTPLVSDSRTIKNELVSLKSELERLGNTASFNTKTLFGGDYFGDFQRSQIGPDNSISNQISITLEDFTHFVLTLPDDPNIFQPDPDADAAEWEAFARSILADIDESNPAVPEASRFGLPRLYTTMARIGQIQNQIDSAIENLNTQYIALASADSQISDTDMASELTQYVKRNIVVQSSNAVAAQANATPQAVSYLISSNVETRKVLL